MSRNIEWHGDEAKRLVQRRAIQFITRAAIEVKREAQKLLSVAGTGTASSSLTRTSKGVTKTFRKGRRIYNANPSKPGEPPRKQTGHLRRSIAYEVDRQAMTARVGTNVEYGRHLELGTQRGLAPRPWLRRSLAQVASRVNWLLAQIGTTP